MWDEEKYEGDIPEGWGALSGAQETDRFWWAFSLGVHAGHSETILRADTRVRVRVRVRARARVRVGVGVRVRVRVRVRVGVRVRCS